MKKTINIIITLVALLAFTPFMRAQDTDPDPASAPIPFPADPNVKFDPSEWNKEYTIDTYSKVAYRKIISQPNTQGIYHILLDAFTTGQEVKLQKAVRADIVLVLDVSGSMNDDMNGQSTYVDANRRITALKNAVNTFIDLINKNDTENAPSSSLTGRLGNRIAIVPFSHELATSGSNQVRDFNTLDNAQAMKNQVNQLNPSGGTYAHLGMERALQLLNNSTAQIRTVVLFTDGNPGLFGLWEGRTYTNQWIYATQSNVQNYYIDHSGELNYENTLASANMTINYASQIKALARENDDPTKTVISNVFTVSIIPIEQTSEFTQVYLGKTSSNWKKDATNMGSYTLTSTGTGSNYRTTVHGWNSSNIWANGPGTRNKTKNAQGVEVDETKYAISAQNASDLEAAFATIAESTGGTSEGLGESSIATVDVVSASFVLPKGYDESNIRVYTSKCLSVPASGQPVFGPDTLATQRKDKYQPMKKVDGILRPDGDPKDVDDLIKVKINTSVITGKKDSISVDGFDYTNNWCGEVVENNQHVGWHGNKVTILIPIKMNPDALGGVGVDTNGDGSGIYVDGENKFPFTSPKVNLPVNIIINKQGLDVGESSKFTIYKSIDKSNWTPVTSVFVTRHSGQGPNDPRTRIEGLPATDNQNREYVYKVVEDNWSWSYTLTSDGELLTDDNDNPFTFTNQKKNRIDTKIRHAESKATNTFKTRGGAQYDDSKSNGRTVITVTTGSN